MPLAGLGRLPLGAVLLWATVSNILWCALLLGVGLVTGSQVKDFTQLQGSFRGIALAAGAVAFVALALLTARALLNRRRTSLAEGPVSSP